MSFRMNINGIAVISSFVKISGLTYVSANALSNSIASPTTVSCSSCSSLLRLCFFDRARRTVACVCEFNGVFASLMRCHIGACLMLFE